MLASIGTAALQLGMAIRNSPGFLVENWESPSLIAEY